jgi:DNA-directed RNA polymerase I subunit RPA2
LRGCAGFAKNGGEVMISGVTGEPFPVDIYIGVVYYQRLRHMVSDKFQARASACRPQSQQFPVLAVPSRPMLGTAPLPLNPLY